MHEQDTTLDEFRNWGLTVLQPLNGNRISLDPLLLCGFTRVQGGERLVDLGTGTGIIPLVLMRRGAAEATGIEVSTDMADLARRNSDLNGLADRLTVLDDDILNVRAHFDVSSFDLVTANPPYRRPGTGRISPRSGRDVARHETTAGLADFLGTAKYLVKPSGRICFIYHVCRLADFFRLAAEIKLSVLRLRLVHGRIDLPATTFLVEMAKGSRGDLQVLPPLVVRGVDDCYTDEVKDLLEGCA